MSTVVGTVWGEDTERDFAAVRAAIQVHGAELAALPGVLSIRAGYRFAAGRILPQPALVVTVGLKLDKSRIPPGQAIPPTLGSVLVDVAPASPVEVLRHLNRHQDATAHALAEIDLRLPDQAFDDAVLLDAAGLLPYPPRPDLPLEVCDEEMTVICHASPDAGWRVLREFLQGAQERLTATMYEFDADHIVDTLITIPTPRRLEAVFDSAVGAGVPLELEQALGPRFDFVWAATADSPRTTGGFFPSAYHIKVAVRDGQAFWLSSGNWKSSSQPAEDPIKGPKPADPGLFQRTRNREWHVVVHNPTLAKQFEAHIRRDIEQAKPLQSIAPQALAAADALSLPDLFVPIPETDEAPVFVEEEVVTRKVRVQPLLTPDNFIDHILPLIKGAAQSILFQNQTLNPTQANTALINALAAKSNSADLDVRIIMRDASEFNGSVRKTLEALKKKGFNMDRVKVQRGCHNKGIVVDGRYTVVGSHNWSGAGVTTNRDASLIFDDPGIAAYYTRLFNYDWLRLAVHHDPNEADPIRLAGDDELTPPGMIRVPWREHFDGFERVAGWISAPLNPTEGDEPEAHFTLDPDSLDLNPLGFRSSAETRTGLLRKHDGDFKPVLYSPVGEFALLEGDILLGTTESVAAQFADPQEALASAVGVSGDEFRWDGGQVPYVITELGLAERVMKAIAHWEERTPIRFIERTSQNAARHPDFVSFEEHGGCFSNIGRQGGRQIISLGPGCTVGNAIHEVGHMLGCFHEQSREDRDQFVTVQLENVQAGMEHNFNQHVTDGDDIGQYDFGSIMHYPATAFSKNGQPTVVTKGGQSIGQRNGLSVGDIAAIRALYPDLIWPSPGGQRN